MADGNSLGSSRRGSPEELAHDVFLSFRGEVRRSFIDHLRSALKGERITAFYDDEGLERGEEIQSKLYEAIESSKIAIVTFSPEYADSRWCLNELVKIMERRGSHGLIVLPVFYRVEPTHVRYHSGPYEKAFDEHKKTYAEWVNEWKQALKSAANLAGFHLQNQTDGFEAPFIKDIVKEVVRRIDARQVEIPKYMVGKESSLIQNLNKWLQEVSSKAEVGILHGPGGVGKTTTAKVVYNKNYGRFESSSFLLDVRKAYGEGRPFIGLQEQLICNISGKEAVKIYDASDGRQKIKKAIGSKPILVVLDDVDEAKQLEAMFDCTDWDWDWLPHGSKILITTRNQHFLINDESIARFQACLQNGKNSTELFSHHAFGQAYPPPDYVNIAKQFVKYCGGLPLALRVLASSLRSTPLDKWKYELGRLQEYPHEEVFKVLLWSFDSLQDSTVQDIFLHIAFFMVGRDKEYVLKILDGCGLHGTIGLENLIGKCLVSVHKQNNTLMMHQLIIQMAHEVVRREQPTDLGCRTRILGHKDAYDVLRKKTGTSTVKGLHFKIQDPPEDNLSSKEPNVKPMRMTYISTDAFTKMRNLDLLLLENVQLRGGFKNFPNVIKWLFWRRCSLNEIPLDYHLEELVALDMQNSCLTRVWKNDLKNKCNLKLLNLSHSHLLVSTPDFSATPELEWISFEDCIKLNKVHESIGDLKNLTHLNLEGCVNLDTLPKSMKSLEKLTSIRVKGCRKLTNLPINEHWSIEELDLDGCPNLNIYANQVAKSSAAALERAAQI